LAYPIPTCSVALHSRPVHMEGSDCSPFSVFWRLVVIHFCLLLISAWEMACALFQCGWLNVRIICSVFIHPLSRLWPAVSLLCEHATFHREAGCSQYNTGVMQPGSAAKPAAQPGGWLPVWPVIPAGWLANGGWPANVLMTILWWWWCWPDDVDSTHWLLTLKLLFLFYCCFVKFTYSIHWSTMEVLFIQ